MQKPFQVGNTVDPGAFVNRRRELRRVAGGIANGGQSSAVIGEPRTGKTSLLRYLMAPETQDALYGEEAAKLRFQYLDAQTLGGGFDAAKFWEQALQPVAELAQAGPGLQAAYDTCRQENFGTFVLERLFTQMGAAGWRLVLLLDEFDTVLHHPALNQAEFYGGLRSLASRLDSLALVIAARQPLGELNRATADFSRMGSPYFNFLQEVALGAFKDKDALALLEGGKEHFSRKDHTYLWRVAGGHPYLLQAAASALWEAYEDGESQAHRRYEQAGKALFQQAAPTLQDTWRLWKPEMKKAFTIIALDNIPRLLGEEKRYDVNALVSALPDYTPELRALETRGYIVADPALPGGWGVQAEVMLWWLAEELIQALRQQDDLSAWLQGEEWEGLLRGKEKAALVKAAKGAGVLLKVGSEGFIKAAAEGLGKAVAAR